MSRNNQKKWFFLTVSVSHQETTFSIWMSIKFSILHTAFCVCITTEYNYIRRNGQNIYFSRKIIINLRVKKSEMAQFDNLMSHYLENIHNSGSDLPTFNWILFFMRFFLFFYYFWFLFHSCLLHISPYNIYLSHD